MSKAVPALLLLLQTEGRSIKPCFVHGDCWDGNTAMADDSRVLSLMLLPSMLTTNMMWAIGDHPDMSLATRPT